RASSISRACLRCSTARSPHARQASPTRQRPPASLTRSHTTRGPEHVEASAIEMRVLGEHPAESAGAGRRNLALPRYPGPACAARPQEALTPGRLALLGSDRRLLSPAAPPRAALSTSRPAPSRCAFSASTRRKARARGGETSRFLDIQGLLALLDRKKPSRQAG